MAIPPVPHQLVEDLAKALKAPAVGNAAAGTAEALANVAAPDFQPELVTFTGFLGGTVEQPAVGGGVKVWRLLYLDVQLRSWLLVEEVGIVETAKVRDDNVPVTKDRDVIWVRDEASVALGGGPQSVEARFLTGDFTRAGDFDASPVGGTLAASTGVFCEASTVSCCRRGSQ